jgi:hypothetical protein
MRRGHFGAGAFTLAGAFLIAVVAGCSSGKKDEGGTGDGSKDGGTPPPSATRTPVKSGNAVVKGKVNFTGDMPDLKQMTAALQEQMKREKPDQLEHCLNMAPEEQKQQQVWNIGDGGGVKNVVVWLTPARGSFFAVDEDHPGVKAVQEKPVELDQPHCAFVPHVLALFPEYRDENNKPHPTKQEFVVKNSAGIAHNSNFRGGPKNPPRNEALGAGKDVKPKPFTPENQPITVSCDIHKWMNGFVWVFDHPYYAITDENGNFEIKNAPAGKFNIVAWHEGHPGKFITGSGGEEIELKEGETTTKDFQVKAK